MVVDAGSNDDIDLKSDHRCMHACIEFREESPKRKRGSKRRANGRDLDVDSYHAELDRLVSSNPADATGLVRGIVDAAELCSNKNARTHATGKVTGVD